MSACSSCTNKQEIDNARYTEIKRKANMDAKSRGLSAFALIRTKNANPGYMWRTIDHEDCQRLEVIEYCTVV
jgi:hypothetical protein